MNAKLFEIVFERLAESHLSGDESNLVLSACQGEEALQSWLVEGVAPHLEGRIGQLETGPGAYLQSIRVQGFRGIGENLELKLRTGPGLAQLVGRNVSGKSSQAEALELHHTGHTARWRNLHHPGELASELAPTESVATRNFADESEIDCTKSIANWLREITGFIRNVPAWPAGVLFRSLARRNLTRHGLV